MKIIFLDVDGVLNHWCGEKSYTEQKKWHKRHNENYDFNHINVRWCKKFLKYAIRYDYKIVISSSWRTMEGNMEALRNVLGKHISNNIVDRTGKHRCRDKVFNGRELEILHYLDEIDYCFEHFIILDDEVRNIKNTIKISTRKGFRRNNYKLGLKMIK